MCRLPQQNYQPQPVFTQKRLSVHSSPRGTHESTSVPPAPVSDAGGLAFPPLAAPPASHSGGPTRVPGPRHTSRQEPTLCLGSPRFEGVPVAHGHESC